MRRLAFFVSALAMSAGATLAAAPLPEMTMAASLTSSDNGKTVELHVGATATLRLPENPSTGYRWAVDAADAKVADVAQQSFEAGSSTPGAGGQAQWAITARAPGAATIKLKRWRSWEGDASIAERFEVTVRVSP